MRSRRSESLPEPDLASQAAARNAARLLVVNNELDTVVDVAKGNLAADDVAEDWLKPVAAPAPGALPAALIQSWLITFSGALNTVQRTAQSLLTQSGYVTPGDLEASVQIAEQVLAMAKKAAAAQSA